jgi:hypothetical protein
MAIQNGTYKARASGEVVLGTSKNKGTPFIQFYLTITQGDNKGGAVRYDGYFTEATNERTIQSLQICGWQGEDLSEFSDGGLHGLDANEVDIVVEIETYTHQESGEERHRPRVAWINRTGGFLATEQAMNDDAAKAFAERMRGLVLAVKAKNPVKDGTDFKFGANQGAPPAAPPPASAGKKAF